MSQVGSSASTGIASINADTTSAQVIAGSNNISASTSSGTTTINGTLLAPKAAPTFTTSITFGNARLDPVVQALGNLGATKTIDLSLGSIVTGTLNANCTVTLTNPQTGSAYVAQINTGAGSFSLTWPATVKNPPTVTQTASKVDIYWLWYDGTNFWMTANQGQAA